jgi:hypothetical protein
MSQKVLSLSDLYKSKLGLFYFWRRRLVNKSLLKIVFGPNLDETTAGWSIT